MYNLNSHAKAGGILEENLAGKNTGNEVEDGLAQSDMTPLTEGSTSEEDGGWLGGIGADFRNIANSFKDAVPPTIGAIGDIANFVQRSALSVAAEIAQLERDSSDEETGDMDHAIHLPWEIRVEAENGQTAYEEDAELKANIMALSSDRMTFLKPFFVKGSSNCEEDGNLVVLDEPRIHQIQRLLAIDENLAATHSVLSGRSDVKETVFWTNYFFNCEKVAEKVRRQHLEKKQSSSLISTLTIPPSLEEPWEGGEVLPAKVEEAKARENLSRTPSQNSLVPADDSSSQAPLDTSVDDAASFVQVSSRAGIASPPCSLVSLEDLVLVNKSLSEQKD